MSVAATEIGPGLLVTWDRQARRNAWDLETMTAIADAIETAPDEKARCVVLRGAGEHWSAGDDLHSALEGTKETWTQTIAAFQRLTRVVLASPVPVLCAIDGWCVGGALEFAASCDLRICTDRVRLLTPEVTIGFVFSNGAAFFLPHVLGETRARELLLAGEPRDIGWADGFANEVVAPDQLDAAIDRWVERLAAPGGEAVAATKRILNERFGDLMEATLEREARWCVDLYDRPEARAALQDFRARRR
ncbi:MAG TPA: enoyl-CoA hydratase/isomerase family protein [Thermoleophilaceae bacterium]|nr:enoyl-CoA hydratase/isomerase family protein [Thermoleophilaceae bacterium]